MKLFIERLQSKQSDKERFIETIAQTLDIKYDAAYRRVTHKAKLSLEEALILAKKYHVSLDSLIEGSEQELIFLSKIPAIKDVNGMIQYLDESAKRLKLFAKSNPTEMVYMSKDLPIFYTLEDNELTKFKFYSWLWMLDEPFSKKQLALRDFQLPKELLLKAQELASVFGNLSCTEFWNETTLNSMLYQISYFESLELLSAYEKQKIGTQLLQLVLKIEEKATQNSEKYHLYWNEMLLMNNAIYLENSKRSTLFIPYNILGYIQTSDEKILEEQKQFMELQKQNSILLSHGNLKARKLFFKQLRQKIQDFM